MPLKSRIPQIIGNLESAADTIAERTAKTVKDARDPRTPVDTSALLKSGKIEKLDEGEYRFSEGEGLPDARAIFTEFGTSTQSAQPHFFPAVEQGKRAMRTIAADVVKQAVK